MANLFLFMMVSLDGYIEGENHDLSWHNVDAEFNEFAGKQMQEMGTILFGRRTYELMESFWPSKEGLEGDPVVAKLMNNTPKVVVSKRLGKVVETDLWKNIQLISDNAVDEIKKIKQNTDKPIAVLGSNNLCVTLLQSNLLDEIRLMVNPVIIGQGTSLFAGIEKEQKFELQSSRSFSNGNVLLTYHRL